MKKGVGKRMISNFLVVINSFVELHFVVIGILEFGTFKKNHLFHLTGFLDIPLYCQNSYIT